MAAEKRNLGFSEFTADFRTKFTGSKHEFIYKKVTGWYKLNFCVGEVLQFCCPGGLNFAQYFFDDGFTLI